ncbi:MAG: IPT/TIG domain-containing protein [Methanomicrobiales archaeon]|nr:IPT/TIG domain-containing protein [Methanomicrobiales archaeon]
MPPSIGNFEVLDTIPRPGRVHAVTYGLAVLLLVIALSAPALAAPALMSINPNATTMGGSAFILTATGLSFTSECHIQWDGTNLTTTNYVSNTTLNVIIPASYITSAGTKNVGVVNTSSHEASGNLTFTIQNTVPTLTTLTPSSKKVGAAGFNLTVTGTNFLPTSKVRWEGDERNTTYISETSLNATILQSDLTAAGKKNVTVYNPSPGGGSSSPLPFTIKNLGPKLTSLSPVSVVAGRGPFVLTATGSQFLSGSKLQWNGKVRTTTYDSATKLKANILAADVARAGLYQVRVFNPGPGGGFSRNISYLVKNGRPDLRSINPTNVTAGGPNFVLTVTGTSFVRGSIIRWNGDNRDTTYISATRLRSIIPRADIRTRKRVPITVFNPAPGGGTSNSVTLAVL